MALTPLAATDVCESAAARGLLVRRIQSGMWRDHEFAAQNDRAWSGMRAPTDIANAKTNNAEARRFIEGQNSSAGPLVFILTTTEFERPLRYA
jgi:hypothetical protein